MFGGSDAAERRVRGRLLEQFDAREAYFTDSGTTALRLALEAQRGAVPRPIALPAYGCYDLATAAVGADVPVVLYDLDPTTLGPDLDSLNASLDAGAAAIVVAYVYGVPVEIVAIRALAEAHGAVLIEDAAQATGAQFGDQRLGAFGDWTVLSFGRGKGMTAVRGGVLLRREKSPALQEDELTSRQSAVGDLLRGAAQWILGRPAVYSIPSSLPGLRLGETTYHEPWTPRRWSRAAAAMLEVSLELTDAAAEIHRKHAKRLSDRLPDRARVGAPPPGALPGYLRLPALAPSGARRTAALRAGGLLGIAPGYPMPLSTLPKLETLLRPGVHTYPGAATLADRMITLPTHSRLSAEDLIRLEHWIDEHL